MMGRWKWAVMAALLVEPLAGCQSLLYDLQPHRLRRLNRGPAPALDPEFSAVSQPPVPVIVANSGEPVIVRAQR